MGDEQSADATNAVAENAVVNPVPSTVALTFTPPA
jgi:hypothetical protein